MAKSSEDTEFDKENNKNEIQTAFDAVLGFPSEFPYEFDSFETDNNDEEDFFAALTRRLNQASIHEAQKQVTVPILNNEKTQIHEKVQVMAGSPQSTLTGIGSWSGLSGGESSDGSPNGSTRVPSPTTVPCSTGNDAWEVLYAAAGQVAKLKMYDEGSSFELMNTRGLPPPTAVENRAAALFSNPNSSHVQYQQQQVKQQCGSIWGRQAHSQAQAQAHAKATNWSSQLIQNRVYDYENVKCTRAMSGSAWLSPLQVKNPNNNPIAFSGSGSRPVLQSGSSVKRGCGGTGVFLPRQYGVPPSESRRKTSCAPILVPAKVIHALNLNVDDFNGGRQPRFSSDFGVDYDALLARRNALLMQQRLSMRREEAASYEVRLPQEWTY